MPGETKEGGRRERASETGERSSGSEIASERTGDGAVRSGVSLSASPPLVRDLVIGTVIDGKYRIDAILGRGAMGVVAECQHLELYERVALKFLLTSENINREDVRARFMREAQMSAKLKNEHIARVVDVGVWADSVPYMVMEYLEGHDLAAALKAYGRLPLELALDYTIQVCEGVAEAHAWSIVHRDLKPSNLFVTRHAGGADLIKVLDFGISKWNHPELHVGEATEAGLILGSPKYMSPEQIFHPSKVDARSDLWSLGAILYQMLTGRPPFDVPNFAQRCAELSNDRPPASITEQVPEVSRALEEAIFRCFRRDPADRYPNVAEFAFALLEAAGSSLAAVIRSKIETILGSRAAREAPGAQSSSRFMAASLGGRGAQGVHSSRSSALALGLGSSSQITVGEHEPEPSSVRSNTLASSAPPPPFGKKAAAWKSRRAFVAALAILAIGGVAGALVLAGGDAKGHATDGEPPGALGVPELSHEASPSRPSVAAGPTSGTAPAAALAEGSAAPTEETRLPAHAAAPRWHPAAPARAAAPAPLAPSASSKVAPAAAPPPKGEGAVKKSCDPPYVLSPDGVKSLMDPLRSRWSDCLLLSRTYMHSAHSCFHTGPTLA